MGAKDTADEAARLEILMVEAEQLRKFTLAFVALSIVSLMTAIFLVPALVSYAQHIQAVGKFSYNSAYYSI